MNTILNTTEKQINAIELISKFVNQRPGLEFVNYGNIKYYRQDYREILKDLHSFYELLNLANRRINNLNEKLTEYLQQSNDRLILKGERLQYITGQYFPTEYRNAACRVLSSLIWNDYREEKNNTGEYIYKDGHAIRKAILRNLRSRNTKQYFN